MLKAFSYIANILSKFTVRYLETANTLKKKKRRRRAYLNQETKLVAMTKKTGLTPTPLAEEKIPFCYNYVIVYFTIRILIWLPPRPGS